MIQKAFITQWGTVVPWSSPRLVEQDLIICRALVSIFSDPFLPWPEVLVWVSHKTLPE